MTTTELDAFQTDWLAANTARAAPGADSALDRRSHRRPGEEEAAGHTREKRA